MSAPTVLCIEDNPDNAELIVRRLVKEQIETVVAEDGLSGITQALMLDPRLILLDYHLPDINGVEVIRRLRAHRNTADIPVVLVTADGSAQTRKAAYEMGCKGYLLKPVKKADLLAVCDRFLES